MKKLLDNKAVHATLLGIAILFLAIMALDFLSERFPQSYEAAQGFVGAYGLPGVFVMIFIGSSLLPFPTDLSYVVALKLFAKDPVAVVAVAIAAAFVASLVNYWLALAFRENFVKKFVAEKDLKEAGELSNKYGPIPLVLFGVIPASPVFDPLTFVAGLAKMDFKKFAVYSFISRILHFGILAAIALNFKLI